MGAFKKIFYLQFMKYFLQLLIFIKSKIVFVLYLVENYQKSLLGKLLLTYVW